MRRWAPLFWYGLVFLTSCTVVPRTAFVRVVGAELPGVARDGWASLWDALWWLPVKGWHAFEFGTLYVLLRRAGRDEGWSLFLVSVAAILDEFHQTFVPGRGGMVSDVLIDVAGALVAWRFTAPRSAPVKLMA